MTIAHDVDGDGAAVLLLHSTVCDRRMWDPQWPALIEAGYRAVRCDFRGFGQTPAADRPYSDAEDVRDLLDDLGIGPTALVASSYGGRVAVEFAARWPARVATLALLCALIPGHEPSAALRAFWDQENALFDTGDIAAATDLNVATWVGPEASQAVRDQVREMQRHAFQVQLSADEEFSSASGEIDLSAISARCLALSGGHDLPDFRQMAARIPELIPGARHLELPWAGHLPSLERPPEVTSLLLSFLAAPG